MGDVFEDEHLMNGFDYAKFIEIKWTYRNERKKDHRQKAPCRFGEGGRAECFAFGGVG